MTLQLRSCQASTMSSYRWTYDVFLSFRGEDTRKTFVDHLYTALSDRGIHTFRDDKLERGKSISSELLRSIEESRIAIVVFSKRYASSSWCLDELVKIIDCKNLIGQTVVPVFYDVDPSQVRKQTGTFAEAFAKHEEVETQRVQRWKEALQEAACISGLDLPNTANGHESECIQRIVGNVFDKLNLECSSVVEDLVGINSRVEEVDTMLGTGSGDVRIIGILGMGGVGKTTIAEAIYDHIRHRFQGSAILRNIGRNSKKDGLNALQTSLLSQLLMVSNMKNIIDVNRGKNIIKDRLRNKMVLVILDDVDQHCQLQALAGKHDWFGLGSRIIVTTRDEHLLIAHGVNEIYKAKALDADESIQLFCKKAFGQKYPSEGYVQLSNRVISYAAGLPLALNVLGSYLCGRSVNQWENILSRLRQIPNREILQVLKISFDGLDDKGKDIFLDIACFFVGKKKDCVTRFLESCGFVRPDADIDFLIEKSLLTVSYNRVQMHDLVQEMGLYIVRQESPKEPEKRTRLWDPEDICHVLRENKGTNKIEGIIMDLPTWRDENFSIDAFVNMDALRLLKIRGANLSQGPEHLPNKLRWLSWDRYPSKSLPESFQAENLSSLKMCYSYIVQLWTRTKLLDKLKYINLSHSQKLTRFPDLAKVPNLESLILEGCTNLVEIHLSVGVHEKLVVLNLRDCKNLKSLSSNIQMKSMKTLILSGCLKLEKFLKIHGNVESLSHLYLDGTAIREIPSSIRDLTNLVLLNLMNCKNLASLPSTVCELKCLKTLNIFGCSKLGELPENLGHMESLKELVADGIPIKRTPSSIVNLKNLTTLSLNGCNGKKRQPWSSIFSLPFKRRKCQDSTGLVLPDLSGLCSLEILNLNDCNISNGAAALNGICMLSSLRKLNLCRNNFSSLPNGICQLSKLENLYLEGCSSLEALSELPASIVKLSVDGCQSLKSLTDLSTKYPNLTRASFQNCFKLLENQQSYSVADMCLGNLLQETKIYSICESIIPGREVPEWFGQQTMGNCTILQLPPIQNWDNNVRGLAMCAVFENISLDTKISVEFKLVTDTDTKSISRTTSIEIDGLMPDSAGHHVWLGYLDLPHEIQDFFERLQDDNGLPTSTVVNLAIYFNSAKIDDFRGGPPRCGMAKKCGARIVYKYKEDTMCGNVYASASSPKANDDDHYSVDRDWHDDNDDDDDYDNDHNRLHRRDSLPGWRVASNRTLFYWTGLHY